MDDCKSAPARLEKPIRPGWMTCQVTPATGLATITPRVDDFSHPLQAGDIRPGGYFQVTSPPGWNRSGPGWMTCNPLTPAHLETDQAEPGWRLISPGLMTLQVHPSRLELNQPGVDDLQVTPARLETDQARVDDLQVTPARPEVHVNHKRLFSEI
eukprot:gene6015-5309_t